MNTDPATVRCPKCDGTIPADAPQGLCPRCVLAGAASPTDPGIRSRTGLAAPPLEAVAAAFPQFEILGLVGLGGMGVVYKVRQPKLDRIVALKLLPMSLSADPAFAERFHREARFLAKLSHPQIVSVYDFGESGGFCYLLMEFVDGVNLRQAMRAGRFTPDQALAVVPDICAALQYAHDQGVLHRDIKPENILLDAQGRVKIADFGIAKLVGDPGDPRTDLTLTQSGARLGTPHYMAPEQIEKPSDVDHRADIYSLGVVFYELLTGELPLGRFAAPSAKTPLDSRVDEIVMRALAKERELRQQSAGEVKTEIEGLGTKKGSARSAETPPPSVAGFSARFSAETRPLVLIGACVALVWLLIALVRGVVQELNSGTPVPVKAGIVVMLGVLGWLVWRRREGLLAPLGLGRNVTGGSDRFLRHAAGTVVLGLVFLIGRHVVGSVGIVLAALGPVVSLPLAAVLLSGTVFWIRRRHQAAPEASVTLTPSPLPVGMRRAGGLFLGLGAVALLPSLVTWGSPSVQWHSGSLLLFTGVALLSRSAVWRQIAVVAAALALVLSFASNLQVHVMASTGHLPDGWQLGIPGIPASAGSALALATVQYAAFVASLWILIRNDVRTAYGLRPQTRREHLRKLGLIGGLTVLALFSLFDAVGHRGLAVSSKPWAGGPAFEISSPGVHGAPSPSAPVPEGTLQARVEVLPPAGHATALRATFWSNGVPVALPAGGLVVQPGLGGPEVVPVTWHLRSTLQSGVWELSEPVVGDGARPTGSMRLVLPSEVTLRPANSFGIVQPGIGERLRRWLFLPEESQSSSTAPTWGVSVDIEPQAVSKIPSPSAAAGRIATNVVGYVTSGGPTQVFADPAEAEAFVRKQVIQTEPSPSEGAGKIATNVVEYVTSGGLTQVFADPAEALALRRKQDIQIQLARQRYAEARSRMDVGALTPLEVAVMGRDLEVAEARGDAVAEAVAKYSRLALETTRKMQEVGKATALDLRGAEATNSIAEIELIEERRKSALTPGVAGGAAGRAQFFGEVTGQVDLPAGRPTQLAEAILSLGKTSESADLRKVKVQRADGTTVMVDVRKVIQENQRDRDLDLRDGDRVEVPKRIL